VNDELILLAQYCFTAIVQRIFDDIQNCSLTRNKATNISTYASLCALMISGRLKTS